LLKKILHAFFNYSPASGARNEPRNSEASFLHPSIKACRKTAQIGIKIDMAASLIMLRTAMNPPATEMNDLVKNSVLYKEFLAERDEILRHKWIESEKRGHDIGFEKALLDWIIKYRSAWRSERAKVMRDQSTTKE